MSGGENGGENQEDISESLAGRAFGARSASPAKRSAADMEDHPDEVPTGRISSESQRSRLDGGQPFDRMNVDTQGSAAFEPDLPPPYAPLQSTDKDHWSYTTEQIDEQVAKVNRLQNQELDVGQKGVVVSNKWLMRVLARSSEGLTNPEYPKEAREGSIGSVDNSDIVPNDAFDEPLLHDMEHHKHIPLLPGLSMGDEYTVVNSSSWGEIVASYGLSPGQHQIDRYVKNTAPADAAAVNLQYEIYPPTFTIRKVTSSTEDDSPKPTVSSIENGRREAEQRARGQVSPDDAVRLVSSRQEKFQDFLRRSKAAAEIPLHRKVRLWKILNLSDMAADKTDSRPPSPPQSRQGSPKLPTERPQRLILDAEAFKEMQIGKDLDIIDAKDETNNRNYNGKSTMDTFGLFQDATLILEEMLGGPGGGEFISESDSKKMPRPISIKQVDSRPDSTTASGRASPALPSGGGTMTRGRQRRDGKARGSVGLSNLGNTCYMNSALQCIRSVEELAIYFLSDSYKKEINVDNPLGHNGVMAKQYAGVLHGIYAENASSSFSPNAFKKALGQAQPLFSGYGQQDSQEFLSFLVDALHEDLNRIHKKPYIENPDSDDNTVHDPQAIIDLGDIYRSNHAKRNDSVAMDLFNGFYKNTMECPECDKISITFDPFSLVTLQLPVDSAFQHTITFVPLHGTPVNHMIDMDKNSTIKTLKADIASKHAGVDPERLWMAEVYNSKLYKVFDSTISLAEAGISANDYIFMFELDRVPSNGAMPAKKRSALFSSYAKSDEEVPHMDDPKADQFAVPVFSRHTNRNGNGWDAIMHPVYITLTRDEAKDFEVIIKKVLIAVSRMTSRPILTEFGGSDTDMRDVHETNGEVEGNAQISARSLPSEDGYVEVSIKKESTNDGLSAGEHTPTATSADRAIPPRFMESQYDLSAELRNQLFKLQYAVGDADTLHCTGMGSFQEKSVKLMSDRVKRTSRRSSMQSSSSEDSNTSTGSKPQTNAENDESDTDDIDRPDIIMGEQANGNESYLSLPTPTREDGESDNESLPDHALQFQRSPRQGRRKMTKYGNKGRDHKTYSRKERRARWQNRQNGPLPSQQSNGRRPDSEDDNPFYIKLGECIVLDWYPEALNQLFGGDAKSHDDTAGHYVSHSEGKNLPYVEDPAVDERKRRRDERRKHGVSLEDCFAETGKRERLSEDNAWYCNRCKKLQQATKTLDIWTIPDILVVHLKRFGGNRSFRDKIEVMVEYPLEDLDMTQKIGRKEDGKEYIYDLFGVDNHFGGLGGGHYTAMAKNFYDGQWYEYNDSICSKLGNNARIRSAAAYLLFYRRRSEKPLGPQYLQDLVLEARNPHVTDDNSIEDTASDAGEARLGDPISSLRGSPSVSVGAGAAAMTLHGHGAGGTGAATLVGSNQTTKTSRSTEAHDPAHGLSAVQRARQYGDSGSAWGFDSLDDANGNDDALLNRNADQLSDTASDAAQADSADEHMAQDEFQSGHASDTTPGGRSTPSEWMDVPGGNIMRSDMQHPHSAGTFGSLHLEDAGAIGADAELDDPPTHDIVLAPPPPLEHSTEESGHAEMD